MTLLERKRLPDWFRRQLPVVPRETRKIIYKYQLHTVCESALCPNCTECFSHSTATFLILGDVCTRRCSFCAVKSLPAGQAGGNPSGPDPEEPSRIAQASRELGLKYVVVTSVTRDDLEDEGAGAFQETILAIRREIPDAEIEVLTPDFHARRELIRKVLAAKPDVFNHNLETVKRLQAVMRPEASYERSLRVLATVREEAPEMTTKSGIMIGLGETEDEIFETAYDLRRSDCNVLTVGQYLAPGPDSEKVVEYRTPEYFGHLAKKLEGMGFQKVFAGPWVRSSYHAGEIFDSLVK